MYTFFQNSVIREGLWNIFGAMQDDRSSPRFAILFRTLKLFECFCLAQSLITKNWCDIQWQKGKNKPRPTCGKNSAANDVRCCISREEVWELFGSISYIIKTVEYFRPIDSISKLNTPIFYEAYLHSHGIPPYGIPHYFS